jgi:hypothetical protein
VLSPATKIKLATLPIGELMVRHPHFTQPIFLRFPRPAVLLAYFRKLLGSRVAPSEAPAREVVPPLNAISEEPY